MGLKAKATKSEVPHSERVLARISQAQFDYGSAQERIAHGVMADEMKRNASDALRGRASADAAVADATFSDAMRLDTSAVVSADRYKADRAARIAEIGSGVSARTVESLGSVSRQANGYAMDKANLKLSDKIAARQALIDVGSAVATGYKSKQDNDKILSALSSSAGVPSSGVQMSPATNLYDINKHMRRGP